MSTYQKPRVERFGTFREITQADLRLGFCTAERARAQERERS